MTRTLAVAIFLILTQVGFAADAPPPPDGKPITITLDNVDLSAVLRMFSRISGANIVFTPVHVSGRVSIDVKEQPWKAVLRTALAEHGLLLLHDPQGVAVYTVVRADSPATASRQQAAAVAVRFTEAVLRDLDANNVAAARKRLEKHQQASKTMLLSLGRREEASPTTESTPTK